MNEIDIIIPWVNPDDDLWFNDYKEACLHFAGDKTPQRIRDFGTFNYWFRSIEKNMPWVRYIHLILYSQSQIPAWLNIENPKLKIHYHKDFIPEKYLPTFNSNIFFRYCYKLNDLSEKFIFLNDDIFAMNLVNISDYFENNLPKDCSRKCNQINSNPVHEKMLNKDKVKYPRQHLDFFQTIVKNSIDLAAKYTGKFNIYNNAHIGIACLKSEVKKIFTDLDKDLNKIFEGTKFRRITDVCNGWMYRYIRMNLGNFSEQDLSNLVYMEIYNENFYKEFSKLSETAHIICINDVLDKNANFEITTKIFQELLNFYFPNKCSYER